MADTLLGVPGRFTKTVQKHCCRLATEVSFAATRDFMDEMLGVSLCAETIRTMVESHGKAMSRFQQTDEATAQAFQEAVGEVEFTVDAAKANTREEGWKDLKIAVIAKRKAGEPTTLDEWSKQRLPDPTMVLAFAMIATAKTFRTSWRSRLRRLGVASYSSLHVLGDGAKWIWKSVRRALTGSRETLDIYHGCEHVHACAKRIYGETSVATTTAYERGRGLLLQSGWSGITQWSGELLNVEDVNERARRQRIVERLLCYFSAHVGRLNYSGLLSEGRAIGSGMVEGQAKTLGLRLKRRGVRWKIRNVQPMASLICVRHCSEWNHWLQA